MPGGSRPLFYLCGDNWVLAPKRKALYPKALRSVRLISEPFGYPGKGMTLHFASNFTPTCATQLGWHLDDRYKVGHWAPGAVMPEHYGRAHCDTELRLRNGIFGKIHSGRPPTVAFEVPNGDPGGAK